MKNEKEKTRIVKTRDYIYLKVLIDIVIDVNALSHLRGYEMEDW